MRSHPLSSQALTNLGAASRADLDAVRDSLSQKILWTGELYMKETHTVKLPEPVSEQAHGIVLHFQAYSDGAVRATGHSYHFVPKSHVAEHSGEGVTCFLISGSATVAAQKIIYVEDSLLRGNEYNAKEAFKADCGLTVTPQYWVMTEVIGL